MSGHAARLALLGVVAAASTSCARPEKDPDPGPSATRFEHFLLNADGTTDMTMTVTVRFPAASVDRAYTLDEVRVVEPPGQAAWSFTVDAGELAHAVHVGLGGGEIERDLVVHGHATVVKGLVPDLSLELTFVGANDVFVVTPLDLGGGTTNGPCDPGDFDVALGPLGGSVVWQANTPEESVDAPTRIAADPTGRAWLVATWSSTQGGSSARIFGVSSEGVSTSVDTPSLETILAPGEGGGPVVAVFAPSAGGDSYVERLTAYDTSLKKRWTRAVSSAPGAGGALVPSSAIATSGDRVLVGAAVVPPLAIDGVVVGSAAESGDVAVVFDLETGALVTVAGGMRVYSAVGTGGGAFAANVATPEGTFVVALAPDLSVLWQHETSGTDARLASLGGGDVWVGDADGVTHYAADGAILGHVPVPATRSIAPLADGSVLLATPGGVTLADASGAVAASGFTPSSAPFCASSATWVVGPAPGGAVIAARKRFTSAPNEGHASVARITLP